MSRPQEQSTGLDLAVELLSENGFEGMAKAMEILINEAMIIERSDYIGAGPYERTNDRRGHANGFKGKGVKSRLGELKLNVPQVRGLPEDVDGFYPSSLERGVRSERALKLAIAEMYVQGVSTRKVTDITRKLCGLEVSSSQVSRASSALDAELGAWRSRPLGQMEYLLLDARYEKVRHGGSVIDVCVLVALGVLPNGQRSVIGVSVSLSEAEIHWREFLESLQARGMQGLKFIVSDDHAGLKAARKAVFSGIPWQRCQFHLQQNAQSYVPKISQRKEVAEDIRATFNAESSQDALRILKLKCEKWKEKAPRLSAWMEANIPEGLTVFTLPTEHRRKLRTSNSLERLNKEIKRRTRVATLFPNEASLLRLVSAVLMEVSEEWESGRRYLSLESM